MAGAATSPSGRLPPPSFREIQGRRRRDSRILFGLLLVFYFAAFQVLWLTIKAFFALHIVLILRHSWLTWRDLAMVGTVSVAAAAVHWWGAMFGGTERILDALGARPLDPDDRFHRQLENVVREMEISAGAGTTDIRVINQTSLNAFAVTDPSGRSTVGVTEGLLAALDRNRLQAVIAHEMTHIREGDTLLVTMACSLFGVFAQMLESLRSVKNRDDREARLDLMMPVLWLITVGAYLLNVGISRQRESLADAGAVELTRNPLALAEALHVMGRRGADHVRRELGALFIVSPAAGLEEREGRLADLFATHPPLRRRIMALLRMARKGYGFFDERMRTEEKTEDAGVAAGTTAGAVPAGDAGDSSDGSALPADLAALVGEFAVGGRRSDGKGKGDCPSCGGQLRRRDYEGIAVRECASCGGKLLRHGQDYRVMSRREERFGEELRWLAELFERENAFRRRTDAGNGVPTRRCPDCGDPMRGQHYSYQFFLRVDRCARCCLTWFDPYELELLQIMVERPSPPLLPPADCG